MRVLKNFAIMLLGAVIVFGITLFFWNQAHAEDSYGPRYKIVITLDGPPGKQELTYGNKETGAHWYKSYEECETARKGGDAAFAAGVTKLKVDIKKQKIPVEITVECRADNSV